MKELVDRVDKHRLSTNGTIELEIATERFGAVRVEAIEGRDGVQLSLRGDGTAGRDLAALAAELRESFERDGQHLAGLVLDQGDQRPGRDADGQSADGGAQGGTSESDEPVAATAASGGLGGLDLRI